MDQWFTPCVSGILPRPDVDDTGISGPENPKNCGETPLTQKAVMALGNFFSD